MGGQGDPLGIVQEIEIRPNYEMVYAQTRICPGEWDAWIPKACWNRKGFRSDDQTLW